MPGAAAVVGRDPRLDDGHLLGQDRDPHRESNDRHPVVGRRHHLGGGRPHRGAGDLPPRRPGGGPRPLSGGAHGAVDRRTGQRRRQRARPGRRRSDGDGADPRRGQGRRRTRLAQPGLSTHRRDPLRFESQAHDNRPSRRAAAGGGPQPVHRCGAARLDRHRHQGRAGYRARPVQPRSGDLRPGRASHRRTAPSDPGGQRRPDRPGAAGAGGCLSHRPRAAGRRPGRAGRDRPDLRRTDRDDRSAAGGRAGGAGARPARGNSDVDDHR